MNRYQPATHSEAVTVQAMLDAARHFGLSRAEAWQTFSEALSGILTDPSSPEYLDEVAGALAREIVEKQRRILGEQGS